MTIDTEKIIDNRDNLDLRMGARPKQRRAAVLLIANQVPRETSVNEIHELTCKLCDLYNGGNCFRQGACIQNVEFINSGEDPDRELRVVDEIHALCRARRQKAA